MEVAKNESSLKSIACVPCRNPKNSNDYDTASDLAEPGTCRPWYNTTTFPLSQSLCRFRPAKTIPISKNSKSHTNISKANTCNPELYMEIPTVHTDNPKTYTNNPTFYTRRSKSYMSSQYFPIQLLPVDCKLKTFSYLTSIDKGRASQVCSEWYTLLRAPRLWNYITFCQFPLGCLPFTDHLPIMDCYSCYCARVHLFVNFLKPIRPILQGLEFKFDIAETEDRYLPMLEDLLKICNCQELTYVHMNWKETPMRPFWLETEKWKCEEVVHRHRHRQRLFVHFFDGFSQLATSITTLILPFDWSEKSVASITRLDNLHSLVLEKYFVFQTLKQECLDYLLSGLKNLKRLMLEVWTPSGQSLTFFLMGSSSLEYLDISQSRGFYLSGLDMPQLKRFRVARHPWNGPFMTDRIEVPCIHDILLQGAPNLCKVNDLYLEDCWREKSTKSLGEVMKVVCSCRQHKTGWAM